MTPICHLKRHVTTSDNVCGVVPSFEPFGTNAIINIQKQIQFVPVLIFILITDIKQPITN